MKNEFTKEEIRLASIYAEQMKKIGIDSQFCKAVESGDSEFVNDAIEVAAAEWQRKIERMQSLYLTNIEFKKTISDMVTL